MTDWILEKLKSASAEDVVRYLLNKGICDAQTQSPTIRMPLERVHYDFLRQRFFGEER